MRPTVRGRLDASTGRTRPDLWVLVVFVMAMPAVGWASRTLDHRLMGALGLAIGVCAAIILAERGQSAPRHAVHADRGPDTGLPNRHVLVAAWVSILILSETRLLTRGAGRSPTNVVRGDVSIDIVLELAAFGATGLVLGITLLRGWPTRVPPVVTGFLGLGFLAVASTAWALIPNVTLVRSGQLLVLVLLCAATVGWVLTRPADGRLLLLGAHRWFVLGTATLAVYAFAAGQGERLAIPGSHPIASGGLFGAALLALVSVPSPRRLVAPIPWTLLAALLSFALIETRSRGALAAVATGLAVYAFQRARRSARVAALLGSGVAAPLAAAALLVGGAITTFVLRGQTIEQFTALTGRRRLWSFILDNPAGSELWGLGYAGNRTVLLREFPWAGHAHNSWMDLLQTLGILGVGSMAGLTLALVLLGLRHDVTVTLTFTAFAVVMSVTDDAFAQPAMAMGVLLLAVAWLYAASPTGHTEGDPPDGRVAHA